MNQAVFLDRDNTIIHNDGDLGDPEQVKLIQGAASAIASLRGLGYKIVVVTNQGGVARGKYTEQDVQAVNERIARTVHQMSGATIDRFYYCPFHPQGSVEKYKREHPWRKPQPGMITQAIADMKLDPSACWMVGDQMRDVEAGHAAGVRTVLLRDDAVEKPSGDVEPDAVARNLVEAVRVIAQHRRSDHPAGSAAAAAETAAAAKPTHPAVEPLTASSTVAKPPRKPVRPFKPWTIQPVIVDVPEEKSDASSTPVEARQASPPPKVSPPTPPEPVHAEKVVEEFSEQVEQAVAAAVDAADAAEEPAEEAPASAHPATVDLAPEEVPLSGTRTEMLLEQILRSMKHRTADHDDFSMHKMLAAVFQMLAVACAGFGLFMVGDPVTYFQWITGAVLAQLAVITLLMLHGQK